MVGQKVCCMVVNLAEQMGIEMVLYLDSIAVA